MRWLALSENGLGTLLWSRNRPFSRRNMPFRRQEIAKIHALHNGRPKSKKPGEIVLSGLSSSAIGLAVTYFRVRMHTIIGANPFHGPVRDGKAWVQAAVAAR